MKKYFILITTVISIIACLDRQDHQITEPDIPNYTLNGIVTDIDSNEPLSNVVVDIKLLQTSNPVPFQSKQDTSDDLGFFSFDSVYVGSYQITFLRDSYPVVEHGYFQQYKDSSLTFALPSPFSILHLFNLYSNSKISFFPDIPSGLAMQRGLTDLEESIFILEYYEGKNDWIKGQGLKNPISAINGYPNNIAYTSHADSFFLSYSPDQLYKLAVDDDTINITDTISLPFEAWDIYCWQDSFYTSLENEIHVFSQQGMQWQQSLQVSLSDIFITSFVRDEQYFWIADRNTGKLYQCDLQLNILKTYVTFYANERFYISDLALNFNRDLWFISKQN
jgi:hypothetical protein